MAESKTVEKSPFMRYLDGEDSQPATQDKAATEPASEAASEAGFGMWAKGNLPLDEQGRIGASTIVEADNGDFVLAPSFDDNGTGFTQAEAVENYRQSGKNYGTFLTAEDARAYQREHTSQRGIEQIRGQKENLIRSQILLSRGISFEQQRKDREMAESLHLPVNAISYRRDWAEDETAARLFEEHSRLLEFGSLSPVNAAIIKGDFDRWQNLDELIDELESDTYLTRKYNAETRKLFEDRGKDIRAYDETSLLDTLQVGELNRQRANIGYQEMLYGDDPKAHEEMRKKLAPYMEKSMPDEPVLNFFATALQSAPIQMQIYGHGAETATKTGAAITGTGFLTGGPAGAAASIPLTIAGIFAGFITGASVETYETESGDMYWTLSEERDADGKPMPRDVKVAASVLYGLVSAGIESVGEKIFLELLGPLNITKEATTGTFKSAIIRAAKDKSVREQLKTIASRIGVGATQEGVTEVMQEVAAVGTEMQAKLQSNMGSGTKFDPNIPADLAERLGEAFKGGFAGGLLMNGGPIMVTGAARVASAHAAATYAEQQQALHAVVEQTVLRQTDPALLAEKLPELSPTLGENVLLPMDAAVELQQSGVDILTPLHISLEAAQTAAATGQVVTVRLSDLHARLDQTQFNAASTIMPRTPEAASAQEVNTVSEDTLRTFQQSLNDFEEKQAEQTFVNRLTQEERDAFNREAAAIENELTTAIRQNPNLRAQSQVDTVATAVKTYMATFRRYALLASRHTGISPTVLLRNTVLRDQARHKAREAESAGDFEAQIGAELEDAALEAQVTPGSNEETQAAETAVGEQSVTEQPTGEQPAAPGEQQQTQADGTTQEPQQGTETPAAEQQVTTEETPQAETQAAPEQAVPEAPVSDVQQTAPETEVTAEQPAEQTPTTEQAPSEQAAQSEQPAASDVPPRRLASTLPATDPMNSLETARGQYPVRYEVWELSDVIPSHNPFEGFQRREDYPAKAQERAYHSVGREQEKVRNNAANLNPRFLITDNPDASTGPPVITRDGIVLGGNSRTMSMELAFTNPEKLQAYREMLMSRARVYGMDAAQIGRMQQPVLVRVLQKPMTVDEMAVASNAFNQTTTEELDPIAEGVSKSRRIDNEVLAVITAGLERFDSLREFLADSSSAELVELLKRKEIIAPNQAARLTSEGTGLLNNLGKTMLENALRGLVIQDYDILSNSTENMASVLNKLDRAIPALIKLKRSGGKWDLSPIVTKALKQIARAAASTKNFTYKDLPGYFATGQLAANLDPDRSKKAVQAIALTLANPDTTQKEVAARFTAMADLAAKDQSAQGVMSLVPNTMTPEKAFLRCFAAPIVTVGSRPITNFRPDKVARHAALQWVYDNTDRHTLNDAAIARLEDAISKAETEEERTALREHLSTLTTEDAGQITRYEPKLGTLFSYDRATDTLFQIVYHGTPHRFDKFLLSAIGSGEGQQIHGWGLYFAASREISETRYRKRLLERQKNIGGNVITLDGQKLFDPTMNQDEMLISTGNSLADTSIIDHHGDIDAAIRDVQEYLDDAIERRDRVKAKGIGNGWNTFEELLASAERRVTDWQGDLDVLMDIKTKAEITKPEKNQGQLFEVDIPENDVLLDEQLTFDKQPEDVRHALAEVFATEAPGVLDEIRNDMREQMRAANYDLQRQIGEASGAVSDAYENIKALKAIGAAQPAADLVEALHNQYTEDAIIQLEQMDSAALAERKALAEERARAAEKTLIELLGKQEKASEERAAIYDLSTEELLSRSGMNGHQMYDKLADVLDSQREASEVLNDAGIRGITYVGRTDGRCFVIFDDTAVKILRTFYQSATIGANIDPAVIESLDTAAELAEGNARGAVTVENGGYIIDLFKQADMSTLLHEMGHIYFLEMERAVTQGYADASMRRDFDTLRNWVGAAPSGGLTVEQHEQLARGLEAYYMEGKAPSLELETTFQRMRKWLKRIYQSVVNLNVTLNDEVRGVFDRMFATDQEIEEAAAANNIINLTTGELDILGVPKAQQEYTRMVLEAAKEKAAERLLKRRNTERVERLREYARQAREELRKQPVYAALHDMKSTPLDAGTLRMLLGDQIVDDLIRRKVPLAPANGEDPTAFAARHGFDSLEDMLTQITQAPREGQAVRRRVMELDAQYDAQFDATTELTNTEELTEHASLVARHLAKAASRPYIQQSAINHVVDQLSADRTVSELSRTSVYMRNVRVALKKERQAIARKDFAAAIEANTQARLNLEMAKRSRALSDRTKKLTNRTKFFLRSKSQQERIKVGLMAIAARHGLIPYNKSLADKYTADDFNEWLKELESDGFVLALDADTLVSDTPWQEMSLEQLDELENALTQIMTMARNQKKLLTDKRNTTLEEAAAEIEASAREHGKLRVEDTVNDEPRLTEALRRIHAVHMKIEEICLQLDGGKVGGPMWTYIYKPIADAENRQVLRMRKERDFLRKDLFGKFYTKKELAGMTRDKVLIPEIGMTLNKEQRLAVALNLGNEANRARLRTGHKWTDEQLGAIASTLTAHDWEFVQAVWDYFDSFRPESFAMEEKITGARPKAVQALPFRVRTADGQTVSMKGGYYPIKYNYKKNSTAFAREEKAMTEELMGGKSFMHAMTRHGHLKARTEGGLDSAPLLLRLSVIPEHVYATVHDICYRPAVIDVSRIIRNKRVTKAIESYGGKELYRQLKPWLVDCANEGSTPSSDLQQLAGWARATSTVYMMGFKATTALTQIAGLTQSIDVLGLKYVGRGVARIVTKALTGPANAHAFLDMTREKSPFMAGRLESFDRDLQDTTKILDRSTAGNWINNIQQWSLLPMSYMQFWVVDMPTWWGAYEKGLKDFQGDETKAVDYADSIVRQSQGHGSTKDLAKIQRGSDLQRLFTMFYSFFSVLYNLGARHIKGLREDHTPAGIARAATHALLLWFLPVAMSEFLAGRWGGDDDNTPEWLVKLWLAYPFQSIIGVRDIVSSISSGYDYQMSATSAAPTSIVRMVASIKKAIEEEDPKKMVKPTLSATFYLLRLPGAQFNTTMDNVWDFLTDPNAEFYLRDLFYRKPADRR